EGFEVRDLGRVEDDREATRVRLSAAADEVDCIITSGGVSVGEADHVRDVVMEMGAIDIWRLAIKPGKPLAFGNVKGTAFFGLPGNPVSTFVTCRMIALPYLRRCQGQRDIMPRWLWATADFSWQTQTRREYLRVRLFHDDVGRLRAEAFGEQGSGVMSSVSWADALAMVDVGETVEVGHKIKVYPLLWAS
ncbi:MAG: molybdopterin-binding protein, partial [Pseudomonadota bacterium]